MQRWSPTPLDSPPLELVINTSFIVHPSRPPRRRRRRRRRRTQAAEAALQLQLHCNCMLLNKVFTADHALGRREGGRRIPFRASLARSTRPPSTTSKGLLYTNTPLSLVIQIPIDLGAHDVDDVQICLMGGSGLGTRDSQGECESVMCWRFGGVRLDGAGAGGGGEGGGGDFDLSP